MTKPILAAATLFAAIVAAPVADAGVVRYSAELSGANEVPPVVTPGYGQVVVEYDNVAQTLRISASFADLTGTTTAAHIHCCTLPGNNVGVATTTPYFAGFPIGVTSGAYSIVLDLTDSGSFSSAFVTASGGTLAGAEARLAKGLADGEAYFNIHTSFRPGGEIRGNLAAVPEPASLTLAALALGMAGLARRRRA